MRHIKDVILEGLPLIIAALVVLLGFLLLGSCYCRAESYYVALFSYGHSRAPHATHTFASWIVEDQGQVVDACEISWGPKGRWHLFSGPVQGINKPVSATIQAGEQRKQPVKVWLFSTNRAMYERAIIQRDSLTVKAYRALDGRHRPNSTNCIHAVSDVAGQLKTGTLSGVEAGQRIADFFVSKGCVPSRDVWVLEKYLGGKP